MIKSADLTETTIPGQ